MDWPATFLDLSPADFFLWGYLKDVGYKTRLQNLSDLKQAIISVFSRVNAEQSKKVCESVPDRLQRCIDADGRQCEHFS